MLHVETELLEAWMPDFFFFFNDPQSFSETHQAFYQAKIWVNSTCVKMPCKPHHTFLAFDDDTVLHFLHDELLLLAY